MERNTAKRTLEKLLSVCICLCMLGAMLPAQVFAEEADTAQTETVQDTAPKDTVHLSSADDLIQLAKNCRLDSWSQNRTVVLEADVDLSSVDFNGIPSYGGTWEGQDHAITGLSLSQDGSVQGLFRYVQQGALVRDMTVKGRIKPGGTRASVGGIAGSNAGTIENCAFDGVVSGTSQIGGIAGVNTVKGSINGCTVSGTVYGSHFVGGVVGQNDGVAANCTNVASVNTTVSQNEVKLNDLTLDNVLKTEKANDVTDAGGIAGNNAGVLRACINRGTIGYSHIGYNVGGSAGSQTGYVEGCVNYGTVNARKEGGGIVGQMEPSSTLEYTKDTLQELSDEMSTLQTLVNRACDDASAASSDLSNQLEALKNNVTSSRNAIENLLKQAQNGVSIGSQTVKTDLSQFKQDLKNTNLPGADMFHEILFAGGHVHWDLFGGTPVTASFIAEMSESGVSDAVLAPYFQQLLASAQEAFGADTIQQVASEVMAAAGGTISEFTAQAQAVAQAEQAAAVYGMELAGPTVNLGLLDVLYLGVKLGIYPCLIFMGVGSMTDFGPLIANPKSLLLGAAAQLGVFVAFFGAILLGFTGPQAASIGIIGGADGPTAIFVTSPTDSPSGDTTAEPAEPDSVQIHEDGAYTTKEDVALYIHAYGCLPSNFVTKDEAKQAGWEGGSLEKYLPGKCIGGDRFGNREGLLPDAPGRTWTECDINTLGASSRGAERIVFSNDGLIYYTGDHYDSFELLYG